LGWFRIDPKEKPKGGRKMPEFLNPFSGKVPDRKLTIEELIRAIRLDLAAEHEAVHLYMAHADATDHPLAKEVLIDIANEERVHAGEFARLLQILTGDEDTFLAEGVEEVDEMAAELGKPEEKAAVAGGEETTIGSLKE
jgi:rubrerythrin